MPKKKRRRSSSGMLMQMADASVSAIAKVRRRLKEVDDSGDGKLDLEEFKEALIALRCSLESNTILKLFEAMSSSDELDIETLIAEMESIFRLMPSLSGDDCLRRIAKNKASSLSELSRPSTLDLVNDNAEEVEGHAFTGSVITEIQTMIDAVDSDEDDLISREQFTDFLSEWGLVDKFSKSELDVLFVQLTVDHGDKASCHSFMDQLRAVHTDHPGYSARKAVFRVCRRVLKQAETQ